MATETSTKVNRGRQILEELLSDNARFVNGENTSQSELSSSAVRHDLAENGQKPVAAIVTCADSRVAPEIVFGAGIGRVFVARNAGNVVTETSVLGSLEYAVVHLNIPLIIVMGHSKCGAIIAAVGAAKDTEKSNLGSSPLMKHVTSLSHIVKDDVGSPEEVKDAILRNIRHGVITLKEGSSPIADAYSKGDVEIVGALYDIHSGQVFVIDQ